MVRSERDVEKLVREHQKLVHFQVNRYLQRYFVGDMEREDLISWGMIGLVHAARAWDPERSASFSTLACRAIERMIIRGVRREWKPERAAATVSLDEPMAARKERARQGASSIGLRTNRMWNARCSTAQAGLRSGWLRADFGRESGG